MRRVILLVALALGACKAREAPRANGPTIVACPASGCIINDGPAKDGGELIVHVEAEPAILCDLVEHDAWSRWIVENQIAETLFFQDPFDGSIGPRLAERWELTTDALTLHLRAGVAWHDGKPFTAKDVAFTLGLARDPKVGADQAADLEPVAAIDAPDDKTIVLKLRAPAPYLRQALAHISILPEHLYAGRDLRSVPASRAPVGTGPFRFVSWKTGDEIVVERNPNYWGAKAHVDRIRFRIVRDRQVAWELYKRGELDVLWRLPPGRADEAMHDAALAGHRMIEWTMRAYYFVVWNARRPPLDDARVRRALGHAIDRDRFIRVAYGGRARPITGPYPPGTASYDERERSLTFSPSETANDLKAIGGKSMKLVFLATAGSRTAEQLATMMKEDLARAGVELEIATVDWAAQLERLRKGEFDVSALQWTMSLEQDNYNLFHSSQAQGGQNFGGYKSEEADRLMEQIRRTSDDDARHALDRKLHDVIARDQPYAFLAMPEVQTMLAPRVRGLRPSTDGFNFAAAWVR